MLCFAWKARIHRWRFRAIGSVNFLEINLLGEGLLSCLLASLSAHRLQINAMSWRMTFWLYSLDGFLPNMLDVDKTADIINRPFSAFIVWSGGYLTVASLSNKCTHIVKRSHKFLAGSRGRNLTGSGLHIASIRGMRMKESFQVERSSRSRICVEWASGGASVIGFLSGKRNAWKKNDCTRRDFLRSYSKFGIKAV